MEFLWAGTARMETVALLPGAWNPPTLAHLAMAQAALAWADLSVLVLPRSFPHKKKEEGAPLGQRAQWLENVARRRPGCAAAWTDGGLFIEMAREARQLGARRVFLVCGRDAAERIVGWDYGAGDSIQKQLEEYELLVAPRRGDYTPPPELAARIHSLPLGDGWHDVSSSEVRARLCSGLEWASLVPAEILESVRAAY